MDGPIATRQLREDSEPCADCGFSQVIDVGLA